MANKKKTSLSKILKPLADIVNQLLRLRKGMVARKQEIDAEIAALDAQIDRLNTDGRKGSAAAKAAKTPAGPKPKKGRRIRRSGEQLKSQAAALADFITRAGKAGVSGGDIRDKFGKLMPSIKLWLKAHNPDFKLSSEGSKTKMRYFAD